MPNAKKMIEQRKHKRFCVQNGTYAMLKYKPAMMGQITNMSKDGLAIRYIDGEQQLSDSDVLDIFMTDSSFYIEKLPVKTISDHKIAGKFLSGSKKIWQRRMQFGELTDDQRSQMDEFINLYTSMMQRSEEDRRQSHDPEYTEPDRRNGIDRRDEKD